MSVRIPSSTLEAKLQQYKSTVGCGGVWWTLFIEGHSDRHGVERDTSITCLLALLCTPRLSCGIIHGCTKIITCCHSRAPAGRAGKLLWIRTNQWRKWTSGFKWHHCLDFRNAVWLCKHNNEPCAYKRDTGLSERHLDALGESITAPGWVIYPGWLSQWSYRYRYPTGQEWVMSCRHMSERCCIAMHLSKLIRPTSLRFVGAQSQWHNQSIISTQCVLLECVLNTQGHFSVSCGFKLLNTDFPKQTVRKPYKWKTTLMK